MVDIITYRTTDATRWGGGLGTDLSASQIDINFWVLESQLIAVQDHLTNVADIDFFNVVGNQLFVHLTNHVVLGPYTLPTSQWNFRDGWEPVTHYSPFDIFTFAGSFYMVLIDHTSAATFDPGATELGNNLYGLLLASVNPIPLDGTVGQVLTKTAGSPDQMAWETQRRNLGLFIEGFPQPGETLLRYDVPESMTLPAGMALSRASSGTTVTGSTVYSIFKNATEIGTVTFGVSPGDLGVYDLVTDTTFDPGDLLLLVAPASPDLTQQDISFTIVADIA